jgi:SAM-dependent methyltransferase
MENSQFDYEIRRFGGSRRKRRMNQFERGVVKLILSKLPSNSLVVDVPCGLGRFSDLVVEQGHRYLGIDLNFAWAHYAAERVKKFLPAVQASILELPLADNSADFIFSIRMFHHFQPGQIEQALKEISRVAPRALITFYNRHTWRMQRRRFSPRLRRREQKGGGPWYENSYNPHEMERLAEKAGLQIKERIPSSGFFSFTTNHFLWLERIQ